MTTPPAQTPPKSGNSRRLLLFIAIGALVLFGCIAVVVVGGALLLGDRATELTAGPSPAVAYVMDISPRMSLSAGQDSRLAVARGIFADVVRRSDPELTAGLRVFGESAAAQPCEDTELLVPLAPSNQDQIASRLSGLAVGGSSESALAEAMVAAIRDLGQAAGAQRIVVVTGGPDSCAPEAGRLIAEAAEREGIELQTYVVGFMVTQAEADALRRMVQQGGTGEFYAADNADELQRILDSIQRSIELGTPVALDLGSGLPAAPTPEGEEPTDEPESAPPESGGLGYESQSACDHPFFPLRQGAHWDYSYAGTPASWDVVAVSGDLDAATATVVVAVEGLTITYEWSCDSSGVFWYQTGAFDFSELGGDMSVELSSQSGTPLPPAEALTPGFSWTNAYTLTMQFEAEGISFEVTNTVEETHTAGEPTEHSTAAGTFEVIPVTNSGTITNSSLGGTFTFDTSGTCWFALGIGWTGCESVSEGETSSSELVGYSIP